MRYLKRSSSVQYGIFTLVILFMGASLAYAAREKNVPFPVPENNSVYYGIQLDAGDDSIEDYSKRFGETPALIGRYTDFPLTNRDLTEADAEVEELAKRHATLMLTLEPRADLSVVRPESVAQLAEMLTRWNRMGVPVLVRFAHEMNGSWYPWAQNPGEYIQAFRLAAEAVHKTPRSSMLWSPNEGGGYPFAGGPFAAKEGTDAFRALDTNHDGQLTMSDDPYAPYWPGNDAVDWVGLSVYHFGTEYPWGENEVPSEAKFIQKITGTYRYQNIDETALPNFYDVYAKQHNKPFAISETGALYNATKMNGASEMAIKSTWWNQVFSNTFIDQYPQTKLIVWFEHRKVEKDTGTSIIDWRATTNPTINEQYKKSLNPRFIFAPIKAG